MCVRITIFWFPAAFIPPAAIGAMVASSATNLNIGVVSPATSIYQTIDPRLAQPMVGWRLFVPFLFGSCLFNKKSCDLIYSSHCFLKIFDSFSSSNFQV